MKQYHLLSLPYKKNPKKKNTTRIHNTIDNNRQYKSKPSADTIDHNGSKPRAPQKTSKTAGDVTAFSIYATFN